MKKQKRKGNQLFNLLAGIFGLLYERQKSHYLQVVDSVKDVMDLACYETILDVGCGTGALCSVLADAGLSVTGVDRAVKMLKVALDRPENSNISFIYADATDNLPFANEYFDVSIASYVAHGLQKSERQKLYAEMSRVTRSKVIIYDYNSNRSVSTTFVEWLERGDYFGFIKTAKNEMENCVHELNRCFLDVQVVNVDARAAWYICTPNLRD